MSLLLAALLNGLLPGALLPSASAADLGVRDLRGQPVSLDEERTVVFWSMDCAACVDTLVGLVRQGRPVVAVNEDAASTRSQLRPFLAARGLADGSVLTVVPDPTAALAARLGARADEVLVVDRAGAVVARGGEVAERGLVAGR